MNEYGGYKKIYKYSTQLISFFLSTSLDPFVKQLEVMKTTGNIVKLTGGAILLATIVLGYFHGWWLPTKTLLITVGIVLVSLGIISDNSRGMKDQEIILSSCIWSIIIYSLLIRYFI